MTDQTKQPWRAFDRGWFDRHQSLLLRLVNAPLIGPRLRKRLNLRPDQRVIKLAPNAAHYAQDDGQCIAVVYSGPVVAMACYAAAKPLWWAIHYWDELIADPLIPELSYGFDQLTDYTNDGQVQNFDGVISSDASTYSAARSGTNFLTDVLGSRLEVANAKSQTNPNLFYVTRSFLKFDLGTAFSGITNPVATAADFGLAMDERQNASTFAVAGYATTISDSGTSLSTSDWTAFDNTQLWLAYRLSKFAVPFPGDPPVYNDGGASLDWPFNADGRALINSKINGILKIVIRHSQDVTNTTPTSTDTAVQVNLGTFYSADYTTYSVAPKVEIVYSRQILPTGIDSTIVQGAVVATVGNPKIYPDGIDSTIVLGSVALQGAAQVATPTGIDSTIVLGAPRVATLIPTGIDSSITLGLPQVATIQPTGIDSTLEFGEFIVTFGRVVRLDGIESTTAFGSPTVEIETWQVTLAGIDSTITLGLPTLTIPYPDGLLYTGPYINRIVDQPLDFGYTLYEYEDGGVDVNVQPCGAKRIQLDYDGLSAAEVSQLTSHYNAMRGKAGTFTFYHRRDEYGYTCRYVSMTISAHVRNWSNSVQVVLETLF